MFRATFEVILAYMISCSTIGATYHHEKWHLSWRKTAPIIALNVVITNLKKRFRQKKYHF